MPISFSSGKPEFLQYCTNPCSPARIRCDCSQQTISSRLPAATRSVGEFVQEMHSPVNQNRPNHGCGVCNPDESKRLRVCNAHHSTSLPVNCMGTPIQLTGESGWSIWTSDLQTPQPSLVHWGSTGIVRTCSLGRCTVGAELQTLQKMCCIT